VPDNSILVLIAKARALFQEHWRGTAGERFRRTTRTISDFAEKHRIRPEDVLEDTVVNARRKLVGMATQEHSAAEKNYAEAFKSFADGEDRKIDIEIKRRSIDPTVRKVAAEARKLEAEARKLEAEALMAEVETRLALGRAAISEAQIELLKRLQSAEVVLIRKEDELRVVRLPPGMNLLELAERLRRQEESEDDSFLD